MKIVFIAIFTIRSARRLVLLINIKMEEIMASVYKADTEQVLNRGLNAMTKACDALTKQNEKLNKDIEGLKSKIARLQDKVLIQQEERE